MKGHTLVFIAGLLLLFGLLFWKTREESLTVRSKAKRTATADKTTPAARRVIKKPKSEKNQVAASKTIKSLSPDLTEKIKLAKNKRINMGQYLNASRTLGYTNQEAMYYYNKYSSK